MLMSGCGVTGRTLVGQRILWRELWRLWLVDGTLVQPFVMVARLWLGSLPLSGGLWRLIAGPAMSILT